MIYLFKIAYQHNEDVEYVVFDNGKIAPIDKKTYEKMVENHLPKEAIVSANSIIISTQIK